jgi:hypothetical protein
VGIEKDPLSAALAPPVSDQASKRIHTHVIDQGLDLGADDVSNLTLGS